jgi:hypothetical protein
MRFYGYSVVEKLPHSNHRSYDFGSPLKARRTSKSIEFVCCRRGPYYCAGGGCPFNRERALNVCLDFDDLVPFFGPPDIEDSLAEIKLQALRGRIGTTDHPADDPVFLFSGRFDDTAPQPVMGLLRDLYADLVDADSVDNIRATRAMITDDFGNACNVEETPYISNCDGDAARISRCQHRKLASTNTCQIF